MPSGYNVHLQSPDAQQYPIVHQSSQKFLLGDLSKKASAIQKCSCDKTFDGSATHSFQRVTESYEVCAKQLRHSVQQKVRFFIDVFVGLARNYFFQHCRAGMIFKKLEGLVAHKYGSDARRLAGHSELGTLTFENFMSDRIIFGEAIAVTKLLVHINPLKPQCPPQFDLLIIRFDFCATLYLPKLRAGRAISNITSAKFAFNSFVVALREQL